MNTKDEILHRIARYLMLNGSFADNIGLLNGKMGITIFFYHYARYTENKLFDDYAGKLLDEIYNEIHSSTPLNFEDGLCGIGWGMEYLISNHFVDANPDEILEDLDKRIIEWDVRRITDYSLETGLKGIAVYVNSRCENREKDNPYFTKEYILDLCAALKVCHCGLDDPQSTVQPCHCGLDPQSPEKMHLCSLIETVEKIVNKERIINSYNPVFDIIDKIKYNPKSFFEKSRPMGINKSGYAGIELQLMEIHKR
jgi:hypothetical protein